MLAHNSFLNLPNHERSQLRVIQKNLVYITNLDPSITQALLKQDQYLGQYGPMTKITVKSSANTQSAYVIFEQEDDAMDCLHSISDSYYRGLQIKAQFGTSKFCIHFLNKTKCGNPECLFLHEYNDSMQIFPSQQTNSTKQLFHELTHPKLPDNRELYERSRQQQDRFPPSYALVQNHVEGDNISESVFLETARLFSSTPYGDGFIWLGMGRGPL